MVPLGIITDDVGVVNSAGNDDSALCSRSRFSSFQPEPDRDRDVRDVIALDTDKRLSVSCWPSLVSASTGPSLESELEPNSDLEFLGKRPRKGYIGVHRRVEGRDELLSLGTSSKSLGSLGIH